MFDSLVSWWVKTLWWAGGVWGGGFPQFVRLMFTVLSLAAMQTIIIQSFTSQHNRQESCLVAFPKHIERKKKETKVYDIRRNDWSLYTQKQPENLYNTQEAKHAGSSSPDVEHHEVLAFGLH